jgi:carboxylesterase
LVRAHRLDPEKTAPFELGQGDDAVLLVHGFLGSPWDVRPLGEVLASAGYYVKGIRLPGHGQTPQALEHVTHHDWEDASASALEALANFRQVHVVGFSMGALLSVLLAARHADRVHSLTAIAPALRLSGFSGQLLQAFHHVPGLSVFYPYHPKGGTDLGDPTERAQSPVLPTFPTMRLRDFTTLQGKARAVMHQVPCPALVVAADQDHVVSMAGCQELARGLTSSPHVRFITLREGFHIVPRDYGKAILFEEVLAFLARQR